MQLLIKKLISAITLPIPIIIFLLLVGLFLLLFTQHITGAKIFISFGFIILIIFSTPFLPQWMLRRLENQYKPLHSVPPSIKNIVVLGAGSGGKATEPANLRLNSSSLARLVEGISLQKMQPDSKLILSGGKVLGTTPDAKLMYKLAKQMGVNESHIILDVKSQTTSQQAINLAPLLGNEEFILVTSAFHMSRAMKLFQRAGLHPIAAPAQILNTQKRFRVKRFLPNSNNLLYSDIAIHEYLGLLWHWIKEET